MRCLTRTTHAPPHTRALADPTPLVPLQIPEVPLVLADSVESVTKTSKAMEILKKIGANVDVEKAKSSKQIHKGKGEWTGVEEHTVGCCWRGSGRRQRRAHVSPTVLQRSRGHATADQPGRACMVT